MLLSIKDLKVRYDKAEALKGISLDVEEGAIVTLIGANGAGKTTTLKTISGLKKAFSGEVWFQDRRIDSLAPQRIVEAGVAHVPEGRRVFPLMSVIDNLKMGAFLVRDTGLVSQELGRVFEHFPILQERQKQLAGTLSGGEQQMLAVGRALMARPKLLLMDEPTMGLSPLVVQEIAEIIRTLNEDGMSIFLVEQNARMALSLANKGYVIETGSIVLKGSAKALIDNEEVRRSYLGV